MPSVASGSYNKYGLAIRESRPGHNDAIPPQALLSDGFISQVRQFSEHQQLSPLDIELVTMILAGLTKTRRRPDEFSSPHDLPPHIIIHTWPTATLTELTHQLAAVDADLLPQPSIGTRVAYRLLYHDIRNTNNSTTGSAASPRLATQDIGSVVIGDGGPGASITSDAAPPIGSAAEAARTLADVRFVVGDVLSVAILPPSEIDGSVALVPARTGRGMGTTYGDGGRNYGGRGGSMVPRPSGSGPGSYGREGRGMAPPVSEWRRGEALPDVPGSSGRGRGRRRW